MSDPFSSQDRRVELFPPYYAPGLVAHATQGQLEQGLASCVEIGGQRAAIVGSAGANRGDHRGPQQGKILIPLPTRVTVRRGESLVEIDGQAVATTKSIVQVPDVCQPLKDDVLRTGNDFFFVNGLPVVRGG